MLHYYIFYVQVLLKTYPTETSDCFETQFLFKVAFIGSYTDCKFSAVGSHTDCK